MIDLKNHATRWAAALLVTGVVASCAPTSYNAYVKNGVSASRQTRDQAECDTEANRLFPAAQMVPNYPTGYVSGGTWGWGVGISMVGTQDVNADMRNQHRVQCMVSKGYRLVNIPYCTSSQNAAQYTPLAPGKLGSGNVCAVRTNGGIVMVDLDRPLGG